MSRSHYQIRLQRIFSGIYHVLMKFNINFDPALAENDQCEVLQKRNCILQALSAACTSF